MSWAAVARAGAAAAARAEPVEDAGERKRVVVVDANAIIAGMRVEHLGERVVTVSEVLNEVRDRHSRAFLDTLPFGIEVAEPDDASMTAVRKFATATGDIYSLSGPDLRLIALCYMLEAEAHGSDHLRKRPVRRQEKSGRVRGGKLPGWGAVEGDEEWAEVDAAEADTSDPRAASRIAAAVAALDIGKGEESTEVPHAGAGDRGGGAAGAPVVPDALGEAERGGGSGHGVGCGADAAARGAEPGGFRGKERDAVAGPEDASVAKGGSDEEGGEEDEGNESWEPVMKDNRRRRHQRKAAQRRRAEEDEAEAEIRRQRERELGLRREDGEEAEGAGRAAGADAGASTDGESDDDFVGPAPGFESSVCIVTADFAMQNVILQMGLRLVSKDGLRIRELAQYVLRCHACFTVVRDMSRIFCPKCGNKSLDKVQVTVDEDGTEHVGVRRRHVLRGTKFSLPMPRGGREGQRVNPVLTEDDQRLMRAVARSKKRESALDPFAPEYNGDTWLAMGGAGKGPKGLEHLVAGWKSNPNERRATRTNRRRK